MADARKLDAALDALVHDGSLSAAQADLVRTQYQATQEQTDSRKSVLAEIAGYLGGAFVVIAVTIVTARQWEAFTQLQRGILFGALAVALFALGTFVGTSTAVKSRLSGVLFGLAAASTTGTLAIIDPNRDAPTLAFLAGTAIALIGYYMVQTFVGHVVLYGYIFISGIMALSDLTPDGSGMGIYVGTYFLVLGGAWTFLIYKRNLDTLLGYIFGGATLFIATQVIFIDAEHWLSYLSMAAVASATAWLYLRVHAWPLVLTAVLTTTVGVGEFVAETLGGSVGSALGLFAAGVALVASSLLALRNKRENPVGAAEPVEIAQ
jgi:uncharacterized membrane protein